jgi:hypothetical protein
MLGVQRYKDFAMATSSEDPAFVTIPEWVRRTGISRAKTYELLAENILSSRKVGTRTLLDFAAGVAWIYSQPPASIRKRFKAPVKKKAFQ